MPNYIQNRLAFEGSPEDIVALRVAIAGSYDDPLDNSIRVIDFKKIVPIPGSLSVAYDYDVLKCALFMATGDKMWEPFAHQLWPKDFTADQWALFLSYIQNIRDHGAPNDGRWVLVNWGSRNGYWFDESREPGAIYFTTDWSPCLPVVRALSRQHPNVMIRYDYAGTDDTAGRWMFSGGEGAEIQFVDDQEKNEFGIRLQFPRATAVEIRRMGYDEEFNYVGEPAEDGDDNQ